MEVDRLSGRWWLPLMQEEVFTHMWSLFEFLSFCRRNTYSIQPQTEIERKRVSVCEWESECMCVWKWEWEIFIKWYVTQKEVKTDEKFPKKREGCVLVQLFPLFSVWLWCTPSICSCRIKKRKEKSGSFTAQYIY